MRIALSVVVLSLTFSAANTWGQQLQAIDFEAMPSVYFDSSGKVDACGLRLYALDSESTVNKFQSVDISVVLSTVGGAKGVAMIKGYSAEVTPETLARGKPLPVKITDAWVRVPGEERTRPVDGKLLRSQESPTAVLYWTDVTAALKVFTAVVDGNPVQVSIKRQGSQVSPVYYGKAKIAEKDFLQFGSCMDELIAKLKNVPK